MKPVQSPWESFLESGKIDDYLAYCQERGAYSKERKQGMFASTGGISPTDADHNEWNHSEKFGARG